MDKGCFNFCLEQYNYYFDKSYKEQIESFKGRALTERRGIRNRSSEASNQVLYHFWDGEVPKHWSRRDMVCNISSPYV